MWYGGMPASIGRSQEAGRQSRNPNWHRRRAHDKHDKYPFCAATKPRATGALFELGASLSGCLQTHFGYSGIDSVADIVSSPVPDSGDSGQTYFARTRFLSVESG